MSDKAEVLASWADIIAGAMMKENASTDVVIDEMTVGGDGRATEEDAKRRWPAWRRGKVRDAGLKPGATQEGKAGFGWHPEIQLAC
ncbi:MAG: hypothetical protein WA736_09665 [Candidatus Acidiferrum sp.]